MPERGVIGLRPSEPNIKKVCHSSMGSSAAAPKPIRPVALTGCVLELLILDDWGLAPMTAEQRRDLLEIMEDRHGRGSTMVTSQLPVEHWHEIIGDPTLADAILDRLCTTPTGSRSRARASEKPKPGVRSLTPSLPTDLMTTPTREHALGSGWDHLNPRRLQSVTAVLAFARNSPS